MKHFLFTAALACGMAISLAGCSEDKTVPEPINPTPDTPAELADYTIILYGTGGGDEVGTPEQELDDCLRMNLSHVRGLKYTSKVHFTALVRYSYVHAQNSQAGATSYEWIPSDKTPAGGTLLQQDNVRDEYYFMTKPENITAYINEQVKKYPAKKYIFIAWNHGGGFQRTDMKTRTCMGDNVRLDENLVVPEDLSIFEFEDALANTDLVKSGEKFEAVYTDMCLMGGIECVYQLQPYARYFVGAAHYMSGAGGDYKSLITQLAECNGNTEAALRNYTNCVIPYWKGYQEKDDQELFVYDMDKLPAVVEAFVPIASKMASHFETMDTKARANYLYKLCEDGYQYQAGWEYFDWRLMAEKAEYAGKDAGETQRFVNALQNAQVACGEIREKNTLMPADKKFGLSICILGGPKYFFQAESMGAPSENLSYANNYPATRFDQTAQWSKFLMKDMINGITKNEWSEPDNSLVLTTVEYASYGIVETISTFKFDEDGECNKATKAYQFSTIAEAKSKWKDFEKKIKNKELILQSKSDDLKKITFDIIDSYEGMTKEGIRQQHKAGNN